MKKIFILILMLLCVTVLFAQAPEKFTYQAVVRNASNALVVNAPVGVRVSILQGGVNGTLVYMETHTSVTNANGLVTLQIGAGSVQQGSLADINWSNGSYFLMTETDPAGGTNYSITSAQQLLSVPYALYSKEAGNGFSGDYNDLTNTPQIPQIPTVVSAFSNNVGYITMDSVPTNISAFTNDAGYLTGYTETDPIFNAWDKDYNDLINKPTIPTVPTNVSAFTNDAGYLTNYTELQTLTISNDTIFLTGGSFVKLPEGFDGDYNSLVNQPVIPTVPTEVSAFTNDAGYITMDSVPTIPINVSAFTNDAGYLTTFTEIDPQFNTWDKDYNDLINTPTIPIVPTNVSAFTNDAGYLTNFTEQQILTISNDTIFLTGGSLVKLPEGFDGDYNSLTNKPTIPAVPTNVSAFTNDAGYVTASDIPAQVNADWNATTGAAQILNKPTLFSGNYNDLTNKPAIPTVPVNVSAFTNDAGYITAVDLQQAANIPTNVSAFTNDAGYLTGYTETAPQFNAWDKDYNDLTNKPTIPTVPANVSAFANDANYITASDIPIQINADWNATSGVAEILNKPTIPIVPSNVSAFTNDAGYVSNTECSNVSLCDLATSLAQLNAALAAMNNTIDSLRNRIEELEIGTTPMVPDSTTPVVPTLTDGQPCPGSFTISDYDGNVYNTVAIGQQCWMRENLRSTHYANGLAIASSSTMSSTEAYYYPSSGSFYSGNLYNWKAVMGEFSSSAAIPSGVQGICPNGWHVPSDAEWTQLTDYVSGQSEYLCSNNTEYIAKALAAKTDWNASSDLCAVGNMQNSNNTTGFSALPVSLYYGGSSSSGNYANFWSSTAAASAGVWTRNLTCNLPDVLRPIGGSSNGYSVRCLRDEAVGSISTTIPAVTTGTVSIITESSATCSGNVTSDGGSTVTERGVCWGTSVNPTIAGAHVASGSETGAFNVNITGLDANTTYYVRAYATNSEGTAYGGTVIFTTNNSYSTTDGQPCVGIPTVSDYDGNVYNTVQIGNQCWLRENLRTTHYADGTSIMQANTSQESSTTRYYYDSGNAMDYGYLYNWSAARRPSSVSTNNQGICPTGWHLPSNVEWTELMQYVGSQSNYLCNNDSTYIAKALASTTGWYSSVSTCAVGNTQSSNNVTGFSAIPAGYHGGSSYYLSGAAAYFWSSAEYSSSHAYFCELYNHNAYVYTDNYYKKYGYSVRCIRD